MRIEEKDVSSEIKREESAKERLKHKKAGRPV
jgi:hypothetical protein